MNTNTALVCIIGLIAVLFVGLSVAKNLPPNGFDGVLVDHERKVAITCWRGATYYRCVLTPIDAGVE